MSDPYIGEIRAFAFGFVPANWVACNGQPLLVGNYQGLFAVIGSRYGGDSRTTFNVPNLNGPTQQDPGMPMLGAGQGPGLSNYTFGTVSGVSSVTLTPQNLPAHTHSVNAINATDDGTYSKPEAVSHPSRAMDAQGNLDWTYSAQPLATPAPTMASTTLSMFGADSVQAHDNHQPYLAVTYAIATQGVFPVAN